MRVQNFSVPPQEVQIHLDEVDYVHMCIVHCALCIVHCVLICFMEKQLSPVWKNKFTFRFFPKTASLCLSTPSCTTRSWYYKWSNITIIIIIDSISIVNDYADNGDDDDEDDGDDDDGDDDGKGGGCSSRDQQRRRLRRLCQGPGCHDPKVLWWWTSSWWSYWGWWLWWSELQN